MRTLIIAYDLGGDNKDYSPLFEAIKSNSTTWWHYITDAWLVRTPKTPKEYHHLLFPHIDAKKDFIFIAELGSLYYGFLPKEAWDWIQKADAGK